MERTLAAQYVLPAEFTLRELIEAAGLNYRIGHEDKQFIGTALY